MKKWTTFKYRLKFLPQDVPKWKEILVFQKLFTFIKLCCSILDEMEVPGVDLWIVIISTPTNLFSRHHLWTHPNLKCVFPDKKKKLSCRKKCNSIDLSKKFKKSFFSPKKSFPVSLRLSNNLRHRRRTLKSLEDQLGAWSKCYKTFNIAYS